MYWIKLTCVLYNHNQIREFYKLGYYGEMIGLKLYYEARNPDKNFRISKKLKFRRDNPSHKMYRIHDYLVWNAHRNNPSAIFHRDEYHNLLLSCILVRTFHFEYFKTYHLSKFLENFMKSFQKFFKFSWVERRFHYRNPKQFRQEDQLSKHIYQSWKKLDSGYIGFESNLLQQSFLHDEAYPDLVSELNKCVTTKKPEVEPDVEPEVKPEVKPELISELIPEVIPEVTSAYLVYFSKKHQKILDHLSLWKEHLA